LVEDAGGIEYQDLSFKLNFPTRRAGTFSVWGVGLLDHLAPVVPKDTADWEDLYASPANYKLTKGVGGIGHKIFINEKSYLKTSLAANYSKNALWQKRVYIDELPSRSVGEMRNTNSNVVFDTHLNTKFSAAHTNRTGLNITGLFYDLDYWVVPDPYIYYLDDMFNFANGKGSTAMFSAFSQSSFRLNSRLTANIGLHGQYFRLTGKATVEPRVSLRWQAVPKHAFGMAYGKHSRRENTDFYFVEHPMQSGDFPNKKLDFAKAHHFVLSYDWSISERLHLKAEPYYQYLYDVPVVKGEVTSMINHKDFWMNYPLVNKGKGKNYGIDFTLERYLYNGFYYLLTASLFGSKYACEDGVWHDTRLNRTCIFNALGGKEWHVGKQKQNLISLNLRFTLQGGERHTPIDEEASIAIKELVYDETKPHGKQAPYDFLTHFNASYTLNRKKVSHEFALMIYNFTAHEAFYGYFYNYRKDKPEMFMESAVIPNVCYKINF
jgi:hypothetical protein